METNRPRAGKNESKTHTAFSGSRRFTAGDLPSVARRVKEALDEGSERSVLVFENATGRQIDLDLRGTVQDVLDRLPSGEAEEAAEEGRSRGRPRLGVVGREVTLLPRHWEWLRAQPGGASATLRRLVEQARKTAQPHADVRASQEAAYRFMSAVAGNEPGYEEAIRALFGGDAEAFGEHTAEWPSDVREYAHRLAVDAFGPMAAPEG